MKNSVNNRKRKRKIQKIVGFLVFAAIIITIFLVGNVSVLTTANSANTSIAQKLLQSLKIYTEEIKSIEIKSGDYDEPGSWHIDKSAEWTGKGKAKVTFNVDTIAKTQNRNEDVILVIDISGSMSGGKLTKVKEDAIELVQVLLSNENNRVALITFSDTSQIVSEFTNEKENIINAINSISVFGMTNYNQALQNVDVVMGGYMKEEDKDVVTLFLTDGYPNEEIPNQIGTYKLLKDKYPYMVVNGIQYEMGKDIIKEIKEISDKQWIANQDTLENVLFGASKLTVPYEKYEIIDYIDNVYFKVVSVDDITVSVGTVELVDEDGQQKVIWTINPFMTGSSATMDIDLILKEEYKQKGGYYPTNEKEEITSKLPGEDNKKVPSDLTPVLKNQYDVIYDTNKPSGCALENIPNEPHFAYENVVKKQDSLSCKGYTFKGWEIIDEDITKVNDDVFLMPTHNVTIRATWSKPSIGKSMEGTVWEGNTLYKKIKEQVGGQAKKYTGSVDDAFGQDADKQVYIYTGTKNNNVIFADICWKIVRTTTTGGVKLLYNGEPSSGQCTATGAKATIGDSKFNSNTTSPTYVGYMFNEIYSSNSGSSSGLFGADVTYENGVYTLIDPSSTLDNNHHYSCNNSTGTCTEVRYYYYTNSFGTGYYIKLDGRAENMEEALDQMLAQNVKNSTIKEVIDEWYESNLKDEYADKLEDTIFCNDRSMKNKQTNGWNPNGGSLATMMYFKEFEYTSDLTCTNVTDRFSTKNEKAQLKYPIGLLTSTEANLMGTSARNIGKTYWLGSPNSFGNPENAYENIVYSSGVLIYKYVNLSNGVRPVVSLKPGTVYSEGDGTTTSPFVVE